MAQEAEGLSKKAHVGSMTLDWLESWITDKVGALSEAIPQNSVEMLAGTLNTWLRVTRVNSLLKCAVTILQHPLSWRLQPRCYEMGKSQCTPSERGVSSKAEEAQQIKIMKAQLLSCVNTWMTVMVETSLMEDKMWRNGGSLSSRPWYWGF